MAISLPHDVIIGILLLLPAKTLIRFKSTCKSWLSYIESPSFIKTHLDLQIINQDKKILLSPSCTSDEEYSYYYIIEKSCCLRKSLVDHEIDFICSSKLPPEYLNDETACIEYMSCCHGLVFMVFFGGSMILWNPTTRKHHQIPKYNHTRGNNYSYSRLGPVYSFGYDSSVDDYKILRLKRDFNGCPIYVDMYSVNNKSWRTLGVLPSDCVIPSNDSIMFGGAFHFLSHPFITNDRRRPLKELMLSYCLVEDKFFKEYVNEVGLSSTNLCIVEQKLSVSGFTDSGVCSKFEVWSVMNYGKNCTTCWSRTISIQLELPTPDVLGWFHILSVRFVVDGEVLLIKAYDYDLVSEGYLIYDTRKQQLLKIMEFPRREMANHKLIEFPRCGIAIDHVETLVSPYPPHQIV